METRNKISWRNGIYNWLKVYEAGIFSNMKKREVEQITCDEISCAEERKRLNLTSR